MNTVEYGYGKFINKNTVNSYCNNNLSLISKDKKLKGIIVELPGLGGGSCLGGSQNFGEYLTDFTKQCAEKDIAVAYIFPGPWSWGNNAAVRMTDAVIDAIADMYGLSGEFPIVVNGGSMGGLGSLMFAANSYHKLTAVASACPCTDITAFIDRGLYPDAGRTIVSAVANYDMPLDEAMKAISPLYNIDKMPKVPYFICSDGVDICFPQEEVEVYIDAMKEAGYDVTYYRQPDLPHGGFTPDVWNKFHSFMVDNILK